MIAWNSDPVTNILNPFKQCLLVPIRPARVFRSRSEDSQLRFASELSSLLSACRALNPPTVQVLQQLLIDGELPRGTSSSLASLRPDVVQVIARRLTEPGHEQDIFGKAAAAESLFLMQKLYVVGDPWQYPGEFNIPRALLYSGAMPVPSLLTHSIDPCCPT